MTSTARIPGIVSADGRHSVIFGSSTTMQELEDNSVPLFVTSPPYPIGIDYSDGAPDPEQVSFPVTSYDDYRRYIKALEPSSREMFRALEPGGYACINVPVCHGAARFFGEQVILPTPDDVTNLWREMGAICKARVVWIAIRGANNSRRERAAFMGSYLQPLEGCVIRDTEYVCIMRKPRPAGWKLSKERAERRDRSHFKDLPQWRSVFTEVWDDIKGAPKEKVNGVTHPAVMPLEMAERLIRGYSVVDDLVVDPFGGTGTTGLAAKNLGRRSLLYEVERRYESHMVSKLRPFEQSLATPGEW